MRSILDKIAQKEEKYNNNIAEISKLETDNSRIMADICCDIRNSKIDILKEIETNNYYLKKLPQTTDLIDEIVEIISDDKVDDSNAKIVIQVLKEIRYRNNNNDIEGTERKRIFDRFLENVKKDFKEC